MGEAGTFREGGGLSRKTGRSEREQEVRDALARLVSGPKDPRTKDGRRRTLRTA